MSEFYVTVVEIGAIEKHPNADSLSITQVMGAYPCIIRTGDFQTGDKAVYLSVDAMIPVADKRFAFMKTEKNREYERIKAKKIRGVFSMGLLIKADPSWEVGASIQDELKIRKYEIPDNMTIGGDNEKDPGVMPVYTDIEGLRKYKHILKPGEQVILTEKIHGCNGRFAWYQDRLWCGSHTCIKREDPNNLWWQVAAEYELTEKLRCFPNYVFYGEVYGQVQDLRYGAGRGDLLLAFFDILDRAMGKYLDYQEFIKTLYSLDLNNVPVLFDGSWDEELMNLSNGKTTVHNAVLNYPTDQLHCREGFVVKPVVERWDEEVGRVILKMHGEDYLLRKQK